MNPATDIQAVSSRLGSQIAAYAPHDGTFDLPIPGVHVMRASHVYKELVHGIARPGLCLVAQGAKSTMVGTAIYDYDETRMLVYAVDVPVAAQVTRASPAQPFLCFMLALDPQRLAALALKAFPLGVPKISDNGAIHLCKMDADILDAATRLLRLLGSPDEIEMLAPIISDEILMRLLRGPLGARVAQIAHADSAHQRIQRAVTWLKDNFAQPVTVEALADLIHMSPSTFHHHFKAFTSLSPLQYQKALRLQEARRLMLSSVMDANRASKAVGYISASQFSREYSRMFGDAPSRDIDRLRVHVKAIATPTP